MFYSFDTSSQLSCLEQNFFNPFHYPYYFSFSSPEIKLIIWARTPFFFFLLFFLPYTSLLLILCLYWDSPFAWWKGTDAPLLPLYISLNVVLLMFHCLHISGKCAHTNMQNCFVNDLTHLIPSYTHSCTWYCTNR